jgi:hypothetical protein
MKTATQNARKGKIRAGEKRFPLAEDCQKGFPLRFGYGKKRNV